MTGRIPASGVGNTLIPAPLTPTPEAPDERTRFTRAAGRFPTGVTVFTTVVDGELHGMTVNAFATASLEPFLILAALGGESRTGRRIFESGRFAVSVLSADMEGTARWFADRRRPADSFRDVPWQPAPETGCPVLVGAVAYFDCSVRAAHAAGDHTLVIGEVHSFDVLSQQPSLLFSASCFAAAPIVG